MEHSNPSLPPFAMFMKVGPHSGMDLDEIIASKLDEELRLGQHYWGYSGTHCQPQAVHEFVRYVATQGDHSLRVLLVKTSSKYSSAIPPSTCYSIDRQDYANIQGPVQLRGAEFALTATDLRTGSFDVPIAQYVAVGGKNHGRGADQVFRGRITKIFAKHVKGMDSQLSLRVIAAATLVAPFAVWLKAERPR